ncbi:hypothetical protein MMC06_005298 [Schaereria dolodes]|nr:hypothetical protein [Schaereria dolodes]
MPSFPSFTPTFHKETYPAIDPRRPALSAKGKVVLITGGNKGIGKAIAKSFAVAGARDIVILGRTQASLDATKAEVAKIGVRSRIHAFVADVVDAEAVDQAFSTVSKDIGPIDIFVNNAGRSSSHHLTKDVPVDVFWKDFEVNVKGALIATQAFMRNCAKNGAILLNISAGAAHIKYFAPVASYCTSKNAFARVIDHIEMENPWLRVHNVHPGIFKTDLAADFEPPPELLEDIELGGDFSVWICSPEAEFLKGRFVWAEWDVDEMRAKEKQIQNDPGLLNLGLGGWPFKPE